MHELEFERMYVIQHNANKKYFYLLKKEDIWSARMQNDVKAFSEAVSSDLYSSLTILKVRDWYFCKTLYNRITVEVTAVIEKITYDAIANICLSYSNSSTIVVNFFSRIIFYFAILKCSTFLYNLNLQIEKHNKVLIKQKQPNWISRFEFSL